MSSTRASGENGWALKIARSASLPGSIDPTRFSTPICQAGLMVIILSASSSLTPPYFIALAASQYSRRASSSESEFRETLTPWAAITAALYGVASQASIL